ncbi:hypothetical protein LVP19_002638 [Enterococcus faecalis]|nr:hypothetical protein [Enterococcus faecalis]
MKSDKFIKYLSWVAIGITVIMYVSYFPQINNNLAGNKGNPIQPLVVAINCTLWVTCGTVKTPKDITLIYLKHANFI